MAKRSAIVVGAGIAGLATALALSKKEYQVKVFDRTQQAVGASIRNFGMVWPIGQPSGTLYETAMRSRSIWKEISDTGAFWHEPAGSLFVAHHPDEWNVLQEVYEIFTPERAVSLVTPSQIAERTEAVVQKNLLGGLFSSDELIVDPREAITSLPGYLEHKYGVAFYWAKCISYVADNTVYIGNDEAYEADIVFICSGADFETLYPEAYAKQPVTKCKLQMMRLAEQPDGWRIGPALCGGLTLIHYESFRKAASLKAVRNRLELTMNDYIDLGIHVMVSQNGKGELTIGDSHEYGPSPDPFDKECINRMVLEYLRQFAQFKTDTVVESWNGVFAKPTDGSPYLFFSPESGVYIFNGLGGAGMTMSFGLAEELLAGL